MSNRPLDILFAIHGYKPAYRIGGPILSVAATAEALVRKGHRVTVFTTDSNLDQVLDVPTDRPLDVEGVEVWYFRHRRVLAQSRLLPDYLRKTIGFLYAPKLAGALARVVPRMDIVHTHLPFAYPTAATGMAALLKKKPLFYHQRGVFDPERLKFRSLKKKLYIGAVEVPLMKRAAALIALTQAERASFRQLGVDTRCEVIPNGITVENYRTQSTESDESLGIPRNAVVILFMGRLHPIKGADVLLEGFLRVAHRHPDAVLVMAGPDEWGALSQWREATRAAGVADRIIFTGMVTGEQKRNLLARADLFSLPSHGEGFSMAVLEAMASGCAVLLSPGCHFEEAERAGAGKVVGVTADAVEAGLEDMLSNPTRLRAMGQRGQALVSAKYRWDTIVDRLVEVYRDHVGAPHGA